MKKIILASAVALLAGAGIANAKTADELRVYINPGHGSWTPNDRPNPLVDHGEYSRTNTDTLNFFESNTNLRKGFGVLEKLRVYGLKFDPTLNQTGDRAQIGAARDMSNNIVMSHVKCGPYHDDNGTENQLGDATPADIYAYNRSLSEICVEVDANNFDMFISIHSNAATEGTNTNYPLFLYRGYDDLHGVDGAPADFQTTCRAMADACWGYAYENPHMGWTAYSATNKNLRGDCNFYKDPSMNGRGYFGYLGVLKHGVPGFLVEGYFHTYQVARHRAMNWDVDYMEGAAYAHGIADYFGIAKEKTGDIYGIVRDLHEKFSHKYYKPNPATDDIYLPINGIKVVLKKGDAVVAETVTDNYYNGAYVFKDVEPGDYTVEFVSDEYKAGEPLAVNVKAAQISYVKSQLESNSYVPPAVVYVNYPDEFNNPAVLAADEYKFEQEYTDQEIPELAGKTVRRMIMRGDNIYVLALDAENAATILVYDTKAKAVLANVSTAGMDGTELNCSDIQVTADGVLLACNKELTQYDASQMKPEDKRRGTFRIYRWENDENGLPKGEPIDWIQSQHTGNWYRSFSGNSFAYTGTMEEGAAVFSCQTASGVNMRQMYMPVVAGLKASESFHQPNHGGQEGYFSSEILGEDFKFITSPLNDKNFFVVGSGSTVAMPEYEYTHTNATPHISQLADGLMDNATPRVGMFKYAGHSYVVATDITEGQALGVKLIDITAGLANAKAIATVNTAVEASDVANVATAGATIVKRDAQDNVTDAHIVLVLLRGDGKLTRYTTEGVQQPQNRAAFAYDLNAECENDIYTLTFKVTDDVVDANVILSGEGNEDIIVPVGAVKADEPAVVTVDSKEITGQRSWAVQVQSKAISAAGSVFQAPASDRPIATASNTRGGVVVITDPEQSTYGMSAISHGRAQGFEVYTRSLEKLGNWHANTAPFQSNNGSSAFRGDQRNGKAVFADWSDGGSGYWVLDLENPQAAPVNMLLGENDGTGAFVYNGNIVGGGSSCVAFQGKGADTKMYTFEEDLNWIARNGDNLLVRYDIGEKEFIDEAPTFDFDRNYSGSKYFANTNVEVTAIEDGLFVAQVRGAGNNAKGVPGFLYIDNDGNIKLNSADIEGMDSCNSGVAVSTDRSLLAVGEYGGIVVYSIKWEDNVPQLTRLYMIPGTAADWSQLTFDPANNIHAYLLKSGYSVYSLPNAAPKATTPAKAESIIIGKGSSVDDIAVDAAEEEAEAVYYNVNGIRVDAEALTPGVYVKVQGSKATKVVVR